MIWLVLVAIFVVVEAGLILIVKVQRRSFPWLITQADELPTFDEHALKRFIEYSFDPHLGWVRKPSTSGIENGQKGKITFYIDSAGSRSCNVDESPAHIAAFGDSYVFCRQVEDDETWEAQLAKREGYRVLNFGVGNYGVDQALLRYENTTLPDTVHVVVLGFVPETICRIQSYWKHYLEFGNTFAFKPRFVLDSKGQLKLLANPVKTIEDFSLLQKKLPDIQEADRFYLRKFRSHQFRFPYILSLMRNPLMQGKLITAVAIRGVFRKVGFTRPWLENLPFALVMKNNLRDAYRLYNDQSSTTLLTAILMRFKEEAKTRGHIPLVVVMPQLLDIKLNKGGAAPYKRFFQNLSKQISLLDLTERFENTETEGLYINDQYGGHLSRDGNNLVAEEISAWLKEHHYG